MGDCTRRGQKRHEPNYQFTEGTEEHVKLHHGDAIHKIQTVGNPMRQTTWLLQQINCQGQRKGWSGESMD